MIDDDNHEKHTPTFTVLLFFFLFVCVNFVCSFTFFFRFPHFARFAYVCFFVCLLFTSNFNNYIRFLFAVWILLWRTYTHTSIIVPVLLASRIFFASHTDQHGFWKIKTVPRFFTCLRARLSLKQRNLKNSNLNSSWLINKNKQEENSINKS